MHDIFDEKLETQARNQGIELVHSNFVDAPGKVKGFAVARKVEPWIYKAGVSVVMNLEHEPRRDSLHHRSSGLDSTSAKMCAKSGILVAISLKDLRKLDPVILGRTMQNIDLCRQHKTQMCLVSEAENIDEIPNPSDAQSLLIELGMSPGEAKKAVNALGEAYAKYIKEQNKRNAK